MGPLPLSPGLWKWVSWSSLLLLTAFFRKLWPEGTLGSQTMTSALSHPGASQNLPQCGLREKYKPAEALLVAFSAANTSLRLMRKHTHKDEVAGCRQAGSRVSGEELQIGREEGNNRRHTIPPERGRGS